MDLPFLSLIFSLSETLQRWENTVFSLLRPAVNTNEYQCGKRRGENTVLDTEIQEIDHSKLSR